MLITVPIVVSTGNADCESGNILTTMNKETAHDVTASKFYSKEIEITISYGPTRLNVFTVFCNQTRGIDIVQIFFKDFSIGIDLSSDFVVDVLDVFLAEFLIGTASLFFYKIIMEVMSVYVMGLQLGYLSYLGSKAIQSL